eukprot:gene11707-15672_t
MEEDYIGAEVVVGQLVPLLKLWNGNAKLFSKTSKAISVVPKNNRLIDGGGYCKQSNISALSYCTTTLPIMMRLVAVLSLVASATAFMTQSSKGTSVALNLFNFGGKKKAAPVPTPAKKTVSKAPSSDFAYGIVGSDVEAKDFDPLKLSAGKSEETIAWYRAAELKHGRICMLAALGLSVQPILHLPDTVFDSTAGYGALVKVFAERPQAVWQILSALAVIETVTLFKDGQGTAGDFGWDPLNLKSSLGFNSDESKFDEMKLRELKNGRLAMIGTSALLLQEAVTGYGPYEQLLKH